MPKSTGKKGGRKIGRTKRSPAHMRYNAEGRDKKNKKKKVEKHLAKHEDDKVAEKCLKKL